MWARVGPPSRQQAFFIWERDSPISDLGQISRILAFPYKSFQSFFSHFFLSFLYVRIRGFISPFLFTPRCRSRFRDCASSPNSSPFSRKETVTASDSRSRRKRGGKLGNESLKFRTGLTKTTEKGGGGGGGGAADFYRIYLASLWPPTPILRGGKRGGREDSCKSPPMQECSTFFPNENKRMHRKLVRQADPRKESEVRG